MAAMKYLPLLVLLFLHLPIHCLSQSHEMKSFDAKPNGQSTTVVTKLESIQCQFTFAVVGGTNENWVMKVSREKDGKYTCIVTRPDKDSYLVFMSFQLKVKGGKISNVEVYDKDAKLESNTYAVTDSVVQHAQGKFKANLKLITVSISKHDEL
ncbi:uncharacterized protein TRIADDRAFT_52632 [Trichoplax adhaerens]|uniref:Myeloid-derived growth factor n=1 Tax=Trichoplax adhaerens TaxID=10228 RepID=B3RJH9_TRIAD|nr:hypothetical protein TRIADDRAFT_52632 [Trichoplax adhaerens]EDV29099.1 hypothetical protein TRIADDRAFT_52632 [Trichoplax adhaerens]|eukprot:XP_002108301.1 hypothetical protein TRIADDRAFT_52632 [Trichoplax adhaerens]